MQDDNDVRRSRRQQGLPPLPPSVVPSVNSFHSATDEGSWETVQSTARSAVSHSSSSSRRRRQELELQRMQEEAELEDVLEEQRLRFQMLKGERKKAIAKKRYDIEMARIDEDDDGNSSQNLSGEDEAISPPKEKEFTPTEREEIQKWLSTSNSAEKRPTSPVDVKIDSQKPEDQRPPTPPTPEQVRNEGVKDISMFIARQSIAKDLTVFNGDPKDWPMFISQFRGTTAACGFSDFENMTRLDKALRGKAKEAVQSLLLIPSNVEKVLKNLEMSFGRPRVIVEMLVQKAKQIKSPTVAKPETVIDYSNVVENLVTTMEMLQETGHMKNPTLIRELVDKLPDTLRMSWGGIIMENPEEENLKGLSDWLSKKARIMSLLSTPHFAEVAPEKKWDGERKRAQERRAVLHVEENKSRQQSYSGKECLFCNKKNHILMDCHAFKKETEEARWLFATDKNVCFSCLKPGHRIYKCQKKVECPIEGCKSGHNQLLHRTSATTEGDGAEEVQAGLTMIRYHSQLKVVPVKLKGSRGVICTFALLDEGAESTLMDASVAAKLGIKGKSDPLKLNWVMPVDGKTLQSERVTVKISGDSKEMFVMRNVRTIKNFKIATQTINMKALSEKWKYLKKVKLQSLKNAKPTILIGQDNVHLICARETVEGPNSIGPVLTRCKLGWALHGPTRMIKGRVDEDACCLTWPQQNKLEELDRIMKDSFSTEGFGVQVLKSLPKAKGEIRAEKVIEENTVRVDGRWETGLLWKEDTVKLPPSKVSALTRLKTVEKKMDKDPIFSVEYTKKIEDYIKKGYARKLTEQEALKETPQTWYLPHFGVTNPNKPGKLRLVFDAAAKSNGVSLNDKLLSGPDKLTSLLGVLLKFRREKIAFTADVVEMFHQVRIREQDRSSQRFLWRGTDRVKPPDVLEMNVMTFGATCSPCLAQEVKNRNAKEFETEYPEAVNAILHQMYVDDYLGGAEDEEKALKLIRDVIHVNKQGGFDLRGWTCGKRNVLEAIPEDYRSNKIKSLEAKDDLPTERVLGLYWDPNLDCFRFTCNFPKVKKELLEGALVPTKREILRVVMSVYDLLGFLGKFIVRGKILMQDIWRSGVGWDDQIKDEAHQKWLAWLDILKRIPEEVQIPRCYFAAGYESEPVQLHVFVDASEQSFSTVAYLRSGKEGAIHTAIVMAKTRVNPLKPISTPNADVQAAVMGSRLATTLKENMGIRIDRIVFWTDNTIVLSRLRSDARKFAVFVAHRVGEIMENTNICDWRWVPTADNVADEATRDI